MITLDKKNVRIHPEANKTAINKSLSELGAGRSILLDADDVLIAGNGVFEQAKELGIPVKVIESDGTELIAVKRTDRSTDDEKRSALAIADNRLTALSEFDTEALNVMLDELSPDMQELAGYAVDPSDLMNEGLTDEDEVPEATEATCKLGDLWILGNHRLLCGDSTNKEQVERLMDGEKADMVFTDPPYGMCLDTDWSSAKSSLKFAKEKNALGGKKHKQVIGDHDDFTPELISTVFDNFGYCKEIFLWGADYYAELLPKKNEGSWVVWDKRLDESADKMYGSTFELCWSKYRHKRMLARVKWAGIFGTEKEFDRKRHHPTQKPIVLIEWFFDYFSMFDKKIIADIYGGAGGTLIACEKHKKQCMMMELDPHYCDVIIKRWEDYTGETAVLDG